MTITFDEKNALYIFGCPNREATVKRFAMLAALAPNPAAKRYFIFIARKLKNEASDRWYSCFFDNMLREMESYHAAKKRIAHIQNSTINEKYR